MEKVKFDLLPAIAVVRPEFMGESVFHIPSTKERIIHYIQYLMASYGPALLIISVWIGLVVLAGEYIYSR